MLIDSVMRQTLIDLMASSLPISQPTDALKVFLIASNFTPPIPDPTVPTLATFTGSAAKVCGLGDADVYIDPTTGKSYIQLKEPAGGWNWICTATPGAAETIFGYMVTNNGMTECYGATKFPTAFVINAAGQGIQVGQVRYEVASTLLT